MVRNEKHHDLSALYDRDVPTRIQNSVARVHKASVEYFAAEQSPGNIERHVLLQSGSSNGFLSEQNVEAEVCG